MAHLRHLAAVALVLLSGANPTRAEDSRSLDSVDKAESRSLDSVAEGEGVDLDTAEAAKPSQPAEPAALPEIDDPSARAQAESAREAVVAARQRSNEADAAYAKMMERDYPQGGARLAIVQERDAARHAYEAASARYGELLGQLQ